MDHRTEYPAYKVKDLKLAEWGRKEISNAEKVADDPPLYRFRDDGDDAPSRALYSGLRASVGTYAVTWE